MLRTMRPSDRIPKLMLTILNGGKDLSSKVKFSKFFLIIGLKPSDDFDASELYLKMC